MYSDFFKRFDIFLFLTAISLVIIGIFAIHSATYGSETSGEYHIRQMTFAFIGLALMITITYLPPRYLSKVAYVIYILSLVMLAAVLVMGKKISGQKSWFSIGGFGIQPSEFAKLATVMALAAFFSADEKERDISNPKNFIIGCVLVLLPVALIMKQPDMGTTLVFLSILIPIFFWVGLSPFVLFAIIAPAAMALLAFFGDYYFYIALGVAAIAIYLFKKNVYLSIGVFLICLIAGFSTDIVYDKLQPYQQRRIMAVFDPTTDPLGSGYNVIQSKVAIGSGGFWGKGYLHGTQTQLKFIPEQWTDFIFCMVGEEFGFIGASILIILYMFLIFQLINNAYLSKNKFLSICCIGFAAIFIFHLIINVGMTIGIMPVIGIPLPLVSYGISSLLSFMIMLGIAMNAYRNRNLYI